MLCDVGLRFRGRAKLCLALGVLLGWTAPVTAQGMAVSGKFEVQPTGAADYTIPIAVPPGTAGMTPSLALSYNSLGGNGLLGTGWSLAGLPSIVRCPRSLVQDAAQGTVSYDANDRFCLDGQRLVAASGAYGSDGAEYRTEVESFSKIISHGISGTGPAWFEARTKTGQVLHFGNTTDSRVLAQGKSTARSWALNKVADTNGNYFTVTYISESANGQVYPSRVDYAGNDATGLQPYNSLQFVYAVRPDVTLFYQGGSLQKTTVRLANILIYAGPTLTTDYQLSYQQGSTTGRSRIGEVRICAAGGPCLPVTSFDWTEGQPLFTGPLLWINAFGYGSTAGSWTDDNKVPRRLVDANGDGLPDVVGFAHKGVYVALNTGTSFASPSQWSSSFGSDNPAGGWSSEATHPRRLADVNGDGLLDIVGFANDGVYAALNTGTSFGTAQLWINAFGYSSTAGGWTDEGKHPRVLVDLNGDGFADILGFGVAGTYVALETGGSPPDRLAAVKGGLGTQIAITYKPLTAPEIHAKATQTAFPQQDITSGLHVVSRVDTSNGLGGNNSTTYTYSGARVELRGRGFLGFGSMTVSDLKTGIAHTTTYRQDFPFIGLAASETKKLGTQTLVQVANSYQFRNSSDGTSVGSPSVSSAPYRLLLVQSVIARSDLDGTALPTVTSTYEYDGFGNATQVGVVASDGYAKTTKNTYSNDTTNWLLGRLTRASVVSTKP